MAADDAVGDPEAEPRALADGRDETSWYQRVRFLCSGWMRMSETLPKSIPTSAVMSAIE